MRGRDPTTTDKPYLTCWCTLDDVSEDDRTVYLFPHSRGETKHQIMDHEREEGTNDLVCYRGSDPGIPSVVPAGSVVAFAGYNFHRSGANTTPSMRRVYLAQYSAGPILSSSGERWAQAVPFVSGEEVVYDDDTEEAYGSSRNAVTQNYDRKT